MYLTQLEEDAGRALLRHDSASCPTTGPLTGVPHGEDEPEKLRQLLQSERGYTHALLGLIQSLQQRLGEIEGSRWWRLRTKYYRFRAILRRKLSGKGLGWLRRLLTPFTRHGRKLIQRALAAVFRNLYLLLEEAPVVIVPRRRAGMLPFASGPADDYAEWRAGNMPRPVDLADYRDRLPDLSYQPIISILLPVHDPPLKYFGQALQSVVDQVYPHWELCIADDASTDPRVRRIIARLAEQDARVKVAYRGTNGHISAATNSALALATGEFCALLDHDDLLAPDALYQNVVALNRDRQLDLLYSDEDKIHETGRLFDPHFKPQWCPDNLLSRNYLGHLVVARTALLRDLGGLRVGFEGAQDYDMLLRLTERTRRIHRIPRVLYHWRSHDRSTAHSMAAKPYARQAAVRALEEALRRRGQPGAVAPLPAAGYYSVRYAVVRPGKVSILIPTRDQAPVLQRCLDSLFSRIKYPDFEVIVVDNGSVEPATLELLERYRHCHPERLRVLRRPEPFNFSRLMNAAAAEARGDYLLLLNDDTEVIHADWLWAMIEQAQRPQVGCVGVKLLYPDRTIQHAGVVLGKEGAARHVFAGAHKDSLGHCNGIQAINNYSAVTAACLMVRREVYRQVGGFDEALAVEFNDVDFCLRVREADYHNVFLPHVTLYHHESLTRGHALFREKFDERHQRELSLLRRRWARYLADDPCSSPHLTLAERDLRIRLD